MARVWQSKWCSNMASEAERDPGNGARPSTSGTIIKLKIPGGTEVEINDVWASRILVTAISGSTVYLIQGFVTFFLENPELVMDTVQLALKTWGQVVDVIVGSLIIELDCGSQKKFLKFQKDFEDGKVKDAMEKEFSEIGYNAKLELKLMKETSKVANIKNS